MAKETASDMINVTKDGEVISISPLALADHQRLGWVIVGDDNLIAETKAANLKAAEEKAAADKLAAEEKAAADAKAAVTKAHADETATKAKAAGRK